MLTHPRSVHVFPFTRQTLFDWKSQTGRAAEYQTLVSLSLSRCSFVVGDGVVGIRGGNTEGKNGGRVGKKDGERVRTYVDKTAVRYCRGGGRCTWASISDVEVQTTARRREGRREGGRL